MTLAKTVLTMTTKAIVTQSMRDEKDPALYPRWQSSDHVVGTISSKVMLGSQDLPTDAQGSIQLVYPLAPWMMADAMLSFLESTPMQFETNTVTIEMQMKTMIAAGMTVKLDWSVLDPANDMLLIEHDGGSKVKNDPVMIPLTQFTPTISVFDATELNKGVKNKYDLWAMLFSAAYTSRVDSNANANANANIPSQEHNDSSQEWYYKPGFVPTFNDFKDIELLFKPWTKKAMGEITRTCLATTPSVMTEFKNTCAVLTGRISEDDSSTEQKAVLYPNVNMVGMTRPMIKWLETMKNETFDTMIDVESQGPIYGAICITIPKNQVSLFSGRTLCIQITMDMGIASLEKDATSIRYEQAIENPQGNVLIWAPTVYWAFKDMSVLNPIMKGKWLFDRQTATLQKEGSTEIDPEKTTLYAIRKVVTKKGERLEDLFFSNRTYLESISNDTFSTLKGYHPPYTTESVFPIKYTGPILMGQYSVSDLNEYYVNWQREGYQLYFHQYKLSNASSRSYSELLNHSGSHYYFATKYVSLVCKDPGKYTVLLESTIVPATFDNTRIDLMTLSHSDLSNQVNHGVLFLCWGVLDLDIVKRSPWNVFFYCHQFGATYNSSSWKLYQVIPSSGISTLNLDDLIAESRRIGTNNAWNCCVDDLETRGLALQESILINQTDVQWGYPISKESCRYRYDTKTKRLDIVPLNKTSSFFARAIRSDGTRTIYFPSLLYLDLISPSSQNQRDLTVYCYPTITIEQVYELLDPPSPSTEQ